MRTEVLVETLRERRRSLVWWALGLVGLTVLTVAFYPSVRDSTALNDYGADLPEAMRALFAGGETDLVSPAGYLDSQIFSMLAPLLLLVFAIGLGAGAVAGEEERGTLDLLLAQPLRRRDLVLQRLGAMAVAIVLLVAVLVASIALPGSLVDLEVGFDKLLAASGSVALLALLYGSIALAAGAVWPGKARAIAVAAGLAVAAWILDGLGQAVDFLDPWRPLSPYYQALGSNPIRDGVPWEGWAILLGITALVGAAGAWGLQRRDVRQ